MGVEGIPGVGTLEAIHSLLRAVVATAGLVLRASLPRLRCCVNRPSHRRWGYKRKGWMKVTESAVDGDCVLYPGMEFCFTLSLSLFYGSYLLLGFSSICTNCIPYVFS